MPTYTVRSVIQWTPLPDQTRRYLYEERLTAWNAQSIDEAIELAEEEAKRYAEKEGFEALDLFQGFWLFDEVNLIPQGCEVFSLLRESHLEAGLYLDIFFDTGAERATDYTPTGEWKNKKRPSKQMKENRMENRS